MHVEQFRRFVVRPTLEHLGLWSRAAENLVLGTAVHESGGLKFLDQVTGPADTTLGPAYGLYQIEPATDDDIHANFLRYRPALADKVAQLLAPVPDRHKQLVTNLAYATAICRLVYYRRPEPLPAAGDIPSLAQYWKRFYNTALGRGSELDWIAKYRAYIG